MKARLLFYSALTYLSGLLPLTAQIAVQDGFEPGVFAPEWDAAGGVLIQSTGGANGTTNFAALAAYSATTGRELGARFDDLAFDGAKDFYVDFYFRVKTSTQRQLNLHISDSSSSVGGGAATINLRYQAGWAAYAGATWRTISGLGSVTAAQWYRLRLTGTEWGTTNANYGLQLSDAGVTNFTSAATNLTWFQTGNPSNNTARYFVFTTAYGSNPGFDVDEVTAEVTAVPPTPTNAILNISGTYPHLAVFSGDGECGIGAVVPWADRLWFLTYPPHKYQGSPDKLWTVDTNLTLSPRPESVGGTHANRFIHRESSQLIMGPYFIGSNGTVRTPGASQLAGRLTATTRHLSDPTNRVYFLTMEEGLYAVDVNTLAVDTIYRDGNLPSNPYPLASHPGAHGKGGYTSQGRLFYSNNGESGWSIGSDPNFNGPAGALIEHASTNWSAPWSTVERKTFCEITGPGGIYGPENENDPVWATGWDNRSIILKVLDGGAWSTFRLPKASYTHDALHGWYTEWPRIREITGGRLLMHMHGMFYDFPKTFSANNTAGLRPICTYLRMPVDYCWWNGQLVMARDDASTTGGNPWAGQSHSALWFGQLADLEQWGKPRGFGGPWKQDAVQAGVPAEPFLVAGFTQRVLHLMHTTAESVAFRIESNDGVAGEWTTLTNLSVPSAGYAWYLLPPSLSAAWVRLVPEQEASGVTAYFHLANPSATALPALFAGIADAGLATGYSDGIIRPQGSDARTLQFAANLYDANGALTEAAYYEIDGSFQLLRKTNTTDEANLRNNYSLSNAAFTVDTASVLYTEGTNRFRLPKGHASFDLALASGWPRGLREVVTERRLFNAHGTFYEVPLSASGGFRGARPVTTHNKQISDFASWRGLFVMAGLSALATNDGHCFRSPDGQAALWFGNVDDLWRMGPPQGVGGPWRATFVTAGAASDPYLMAGYESKRLDLSHDQDGAVVFTVEVDVTADNTWVSYAQLSVPAGQTLTHLFPSGYAAHWVRLRTDQDCTATALFTYAPDSPTNHPPIPGNFLLGVAQNHAVMLPIEKILQRATDLDGDLIYVTNISSTSAQGGMVSSIANQITYTPPTNYLGADSFTYQLTDNRGSSADGMVEIDVTTNGPTLSISAGPVLINEQFRVGLSGQAGYSYTVQTATNLIGPWSTFSNLFAGTNGLFEVLDQAGPGRAPERFYRTTHP